MSHVAEAAPAPPATPREPGLRAPGPAARTRVLAWLPTATVAAATVAVLLATDTPILGIAAYALYAAFAVVAPGTLVFRALRRTPHTLVEDLCYGAVVGLVLEIGAWALWSAVDGQRWLWTWPLAVFAVFGAVPGLRRHWWVRGYARVPVGFSWAVAGVCLFFLGYLYAVFLHANPILPTADTQLIYVDLPFQLSLAGEAKHHFPMHVPQVAQEPLHYHWFTFAHLGTASLVSRVDLPVVFFRLDVPLICLTSIVALAVTGWRASGRAGVGAVAAALTYVVGEVNFNYPEGWPFGTIATFIVWSSMSMNFSWLLLIVLIGVLASVVAGDRGRTPSLGRGALALTGLLAVGVAGAKSSSMPVVVGALALTAVVALVRRRDRPWRQRVEPMLLAALGIAVAAELFAHVFIYAFATHGTILKPFWGMYRFFPRHGGALAVGAIGIAFIGNMLLRLAGVPVLLALRRRRLSDVEVFLVAGLAAGLGAYLVLGHLGDANQYFTRAGWMFGVIASAWGWVLLADRARLGNRAPWALGLGSLAFAAVLVLVQVRNAHTSPSRKPLDALMPVLGWLGVLAVLAALAAMWWRVFRVLRPSLQGRGFLVVLTAVLLVGAPGLVMDARFAYAHPNGGGYVPVQMLATRVDAARWLRDHSDPDDVLVTNSHCLYITPEGWCDSRSFWLSAYSERRVLLEGWLFAPRAAELVQKTGAGVYLPFWDPALQRFNDAAIRNPSEANLARLRDDHGVRWLVVDRTWGLESLSLRAYAEKVFDNGRIGIYRLL